MDASRTTRVLTLAVAVGLAWGAATSGLQTVLSGPFSGLANAVGPWTALAFLVGALSRRPWTAVVAGVLVCAGEVAGYYAVSSLRGFGVSPANVAFWAACGLLGGPVLGVAGWWWRRSGRERLAALGAALPGGVFLAEGITTYGYFLHYWGDAVVFCVLGAVLVTVLGGRRAWRWSLLVVPVGCAGLALLQGVLA